MKTAIVLISVKKGTSKLNEFQIFPPLETTYFRLFGSLAVTSLPAMSFQCLFPPEDDGKSTYHVRLKIQIISSSPFRIDVKYKIYIS